MLARITIQDKEIEEEINKLESQLDKLRQLARSIDRECSALDIVFTSDNKKGDQ
jgi:cell division protein FtsB